MWGASDDEEDKPCSSHVLKLDDHEKQFIQGAFTTGVSNVERRQLRSCYPSADLPHIRCLRLDSVFKTSLAKSAEVKAVDKELARAQALVLDSIRPLTLLLTKIGEENYSIEDAERTVQDAIQLVGNASLHLAKMRRKCILRCLNPKMQDMAEEQELFQSAAPLLFGQGFESKMKERSESLKILSSCSRSRDSSPPPRKKKQCFFVRATPLPPKETVAVPAEESHGARASTRQLASNTFHRPTDSDTGSSKKSVQYLSDKSGSKCNSQFVGHTGYLTI